jgi:hypothetical protein
MTLRGQEPAEMVRAAAGFHRHDAARGFGGERRDPLASHPAPDHDPSRGVEANQAAAVLAQVDAKYPNVHAQLLPGRPTRTG